MPLERRLQFTLHALLLLSTFLLAMGDHDSPWPMAMLGVIPLSFLFNDYLGWMRFFTRPVANWAALAGFVYFVLDFSQSNSTQYFLPVINLLLILQMVLLLHEKNRRLYWFLLMLSILEVVIAAAMNLNLLFGLLIFVYVGLAVAVLCFMSLGGETQRWSQRPAVAAAEALRAGVWRPAIWAAVAASAFALLLHNSVPRLQGQQQSGMRGSRKLSGFSREMSLDEMGRMLTSEALAMRVTLTEAASGKPYRVAGELYLRGVSFQRYATKSRGKWELVSSANPSPIPPAVSLLHLVEQEVWLEPTATKTLFAIGPVFGTVDTPSEITLDARNYEITRPSPPPVRTRWQYRLGTTGLVSGRQIALLPDPVFKDRIAMGAYYQEVRDCQAFERRRFPQIAATTEETLRNADALDGDTIRKVRVLEAHFLQSDRYQYSLDSRGKRSSDRDPIETFISESRSGHCQYFATALTLMLRSQRIPARVVNGYKGGEFNSVGNYWQFRQRDAHAWVEVHLSPSEVAELNLAGWQGDVRGGWWRLDPTPSAVREQEMNSSQWAQAVDYIEFVWSDYLAGLTPDRPRSAGNPFVDPWRERFTPLTRLLDALRRLPDMWHEWSHHPVWGTRGPILAAIVLAVAAGATLRVTRHRWLPRFAHWKKRLDAFGRSRHRRRVRRSKLDFFDRFEQLLAAAGLQRAASDTPREWLDQMLAAAPRLAAASRIVASPTVASPTVASPTVASPPVASPTVASPPVALPSVASPSASSPPSPSPSVPTLDSRSGDSTALGDRPSLEQFSAAAREIIERFYRVRYGGLALEAMERAAVDRSLAVIADFLRPVPSPEARSQS
jgi:transglutaminase-like putative cysteine protease